VELNSCLMKAFSR